MKTIQAFLVEFSLGTMNSYIEYYLFLLQMKAVFLNLVYISLDEHFQANRLLIKYW